MFWLLTVSFHQTMSSTSYLAPNDLYHKGWLWGSLIFLLLVKCKRWVQVKLLLLLPHCSNEKLFPQGSTVCSSPATTADRWANNFSPNNGTMEGENTPISQKNANYILKCLILLYLPWLTTATYFSKIIFNFTRWSCISLKSVREVIAMPP